jgi:hypothetical protein
VRQLPTQTVADSTLAARLTGLVAQNEAGRNDVVEVDAVALTDAKVVSVDDAGDLSVSRGEQEDGLSPLAEAGARWALPASRGP